MKQQMVISEGDCIDATSLTGKFTAIIPTSGSPRKVLLWTLLALLMRTRQLARLEQIIIVVNGPDSRTGETRLQDEKQTMLEELRGLTFKHWQEGLPLTLMRIWSRVGHGESLDAAIPWVHTDGYLLMHDDVILIDGDWFDKLGHHYDDPTIAATPVAPMLNGGLNFAVQQGKEGYHLGFPHLNTSFMLCKKRELKEAGVSWRGYHVECQRRMSARDVSQLVFYYGNEVRNLPDLSDGNVLVHTLSMDIGAWGYHRLKQANLQFNPDPLPEETIRHFRGISWGTPETVRKQIAYFSPDIRQLEADIADSPFRDFYDKWRERD